MSTWTSRSRGHLSAWWWAALWLGCGSDGATQADGTTQAPDPTATGSNETEPAPEPGSSTTSTTDGHGDSSSSTGLPAPDTDTGTTADASDTTGEPSTCAAACAAEVRCGLRSDESACTDACEQALAAEDPQCAAAHAVRYACEAAATCEEIGRACGELAGFVEEACGRHDPCEYFVLSLFPGPGCSFYRVCPEREQATIDCGAQACTCTGSVSGMCAAGDLCPPPGTELEPDAVEPMVTGVIDACCDA